MTTARPYHRIESEDALPVTAWTRGVPMEDAARQQLPNVARLPFFHKWVAAMPDVHWGIDATVGCVIPTHKAIIPAAVGVDIGCGMMASCTTLTASDLLDDLAPLRRQIERDVPVGTNTHEQTPAPSENAWKKLGTPLRRILEKHPEDRHAQAGRPTRGRGAGRVTGRMQGSRSAGSTTGGQRHSVVRWPTPLSVVATSTAHMAAMTRMPTTAMMVPRMSGSLNRSRRGMTAPSTRTGAGTAPSIGNRSLRNNAPPANALRGIARERVTIRKSTRPRQQSP